MHFKTLEIQGFKSFPDKTVLTFDSRMTAVVGSNGNGKSNISDALRWVMGEQGVKALRGTQMEDVIFYGTQSRKPMGVAKVSLTIDNGDRKLPIDEDEVVITRKLYRTGDSEYLINGAKSRLKDIGGLFMGTGLGRDGYSIIGQGRIEEVVNSKAAGRRELFEEAAGVSKFLHKKVLAERELERTQENMLRLLDIETELKERLPILEKQSAKAKKAFSLKEAERSLAVHLSVSELERISKNEEENNNAILLNQGECEHFDREITELEAESDNISELKRGLSAQTDLLRRQNDSAKDDIAESDKTIAVMENEIVHNNGRVAGIREQIALSEKSGEEISEQIEGLKSGITGFQDEIEEIKKDSADCVKSLTELQLQNSSLDEENRNTAREVGELYTAKSAAEIYIFRAREAISDWKSQFETAEKLINGLDDERLNLQTKESELKALLTELITAKEETENKLSGYSRLYESKAAKLDQVREQSELLKREFHQKKTRLDILSDVENSMTGYYSSVRAVMLAAKSGRFGGGDAVVGTVADIIKVEGRYATAVEIALGSAVQHIIVANESVAKRCIAFLKENKAGRATFLPLSSVRGNVLNQHGLDTEDGFIGTGHEIIEYGEQYSDIIKSLLGKTVFAEDIDSATAIARKYGYKFKIVTLDGQVINAGGSFTGGSVKKTEGIINRKREIEELQNQLQQLTEELEPTKTRHSMLAAECAKMKLECEGMQENFTRFSAEEMRLSAEINGVSNMLNQLTEQFANSESTLNRCRLKLEEEQAIINQNNAELTRITAELEKKEQLSGEKSRQLDSVVEQCRTTTQTISELNMKKLTKSKDIENLNSQIAHLVQTRQKAGENRDLLFSEITDFDRKNSRCEAAILEKRGKIEDVNRNLSENKEEIAALIQKTEEYEKRTTQINTEIREKIAHKEKFSNALAAAFERKSGLERKAEEIKTSLYENYELYPSEAVEIVKKRLLHVADVSGSGGVLNIKDARLKLNEIKRELSALGAVNYAAIDEFTEVSAKYKVLSEQLGDVRKAKSELEKLISELIRDIRVRFLESFNDINHHFTRIFSEIFNGGTARLELTDSDDVLSSGIEIYAAPPGKLSKNLMALSGGEKALVAITLYFAILQHRPTPFCMLDEVDAALDDVNVVKYINYLKHYSDTTQLMIITHRRQTIEECDVLYGVFMQEKGVSRLLKQEIV